MKKYRTLEKDIYFLIVYYAKAMSYLLLIVTLVFLVWAFFCLPWIIAVLHFPYQFMAIRGISNRNGRKTVEIYPDCIRIFDYKGKHTKTMHFDHIQIVEQSVTLNFSRFSTHNFNCLLLYDGTNNIKDEIQSLIHKQGKGPYYIKLDNMEQFLAIQNAEVISLLEQIPAVQNKLYSFTIDN